MDWGRASSWEFGPFQIHLYKMMIPSLHVPLAVSAKTKEELSRLILKVQAEQYGKVKIISIYFDSQVNEHVCWYLPLSSLGGGLL